MRATTPEKNIIILVFPYYGERIYVQKLRQTDDKLLQNAGTSLISTPSICLLSEHYNIIFVKSRDITK
jgi:hypothetical protein